ncbi:MAG: hypothetical protein JNK82_28735 [Myxococcaceae bacterium]|nr:hypothetical protein [Myxococcaceae bacterium]
MLVGCVKRPSLGLPSSVFVADTNTGGNCATMFGVDAEGVVTGSSGCESGARMHAPRTLSTEERARLVEALDRLRGSKEVNGGRCGDGLTLRLTERSGETRTWSFCARVEDGKREVPGEVLEVVRALEAQP